VWISYSEGQSNCGVWVRRKTLQMSREEK